jgi:hypothetical protein
VGYSAEVSRVVCVGCRGNVVYRVIVTLIVVFSFLSVTVSPFASALFPFVIGKITSPPAPPVPKRDITMPEIELMTD